MHFWRVCVLAIALASGGALLAQSPTPAKPGAARPSTQPPAAGIPTYVTRNERALIPITLQRKDAMGADVVSIQVFHSIDQGKSWRKYKVVEVKPDETYKLEFVAPQEGEYWLATLQLGETLDSNFSPSLVAQIRLIFDFQPPKVVLTAEAAPNGEILIHWQTTDQRLKADTFALKYQTGGKDSEWIPIEIDSRDVSAIEGGLEGRARFQAPANAKLLTVQAEVRDQATNFAAKQRIVALPKSFASRPAGNRDKTLTSIPPETLSSAPMTGAAPAKGEPTPAKWQPAKPQEEVNSQRLGAGAFGEVPMDEQQGPGRFAGYPRGQDDVGPVQSADEMAPRADGLPAAAGSSSDQDAYADKPKLLNKKRFKLDYDIETVGTAGVADVELWGTSDHGQTWMKWGSDPDLKSPLEVDVSSEAVYGFRIVVVSRSGLMGAAPKAGDPADVWVQVDATPPQCRFTSINYGQDENAGKLDIRWEAADPHLTERPITILMSDRPDSGYSVVAAGLPNTGQYFWPYDPRAPQQVYLRLEVRDEAGNTGVYQIPEPIRVEGLTPKARIRSVAPVETGQRSPFRAKLFK